MISDNRGAGFDGLDSVTNVEFYTFADGTIAKNNVLSGGRGLPDFIAGNVSSDASSYGTGDFVDISYTISNIGTSEFNSSDVGIYLSTDAIFDPNADTLMATGPIPGLINGGSHSSSEFFIVPTGLLGTYYVFVVADHGENFAESNETNNVSTQTVSINITAPDLTTSNVSVANTNLLAGETTTVTFDLNNIGNEDADLVGVSTGIYLSTDSTIDRKSVV